MPGVKVYTQQSSVPFAIDSGTTDVSGNVIFKLNNQEPVYIYPVKPAYVPRPTRQYADPMNQKYVFDTVFLARASYVKLTLHKEFNRTSVGDLMEIDFLQQRNSDSYTSIGLSEFVSNIVDTTIIVGAYYAQAPGDKLHIWWAQSSRRALNSWKDSVLLVQYDTVSHQLNY